MKIVFFKNSVSIFGLSAAAVRGGRPATGERERREEREERRGERGERGEREIGMVSSGRFQIVIHFRNSGRDYTNRRFVNQ